MIEENIYNQLVCEFNRLNSTADLQSSFVMAPTMRAAQYDKVK